MSRQKSTRRNILNRDFVFEALTQTETETGETGTRAGDSAQDDKKQVQCEPTQIIITEPVVLVEPKTANSVPTHIISTEPVPTHIISTEPVPTHIISTEPVPP